MDILNAFGLFAVTAMLVCYALRTRVHGLFWRALMRVGAYRSHGVHHLILRAGPLVRLKEGQQVVVDIFNDTDTPEQLHWHGQFVPVDVDGASEEGTPFIPAHGMRRIAFTPKPAGFRFYHTHVVPGADFSKGTYTGQVGPVYIESRNETGDYDRRRLKLWPNGT